MKTTRHPSESAASAVKEAVAELEECRVSDLGTLESAVDVEQLEMLVATDSNISRTSSPILFSYCGYTIQVDTDGEIQIEN